MRIGKGVFHGRPIGVKLACCAGSAPPQGDRKGPHAAPRHPRPYKDYEEGIGGSVSL